MQEERALYVHLFSLDPVHSSSCQALWDWPLMETGNSWSCKRRFRHGRYHWVLASFQHLGEDLIGREGIFPSSDDRPKTLILLKGGSLVLLLIFFLASSKVILSFSPAVFQRIISRAFSRTQECWCWWLPSYITVFTHRQWVQQWPLLMMWRNLTLSWIKFAGFVP